MRRRKEAVLDFTSLLDIVLIILFFFILFSYMETGEAREKAEAAVSEAAAISETADRREAEAEYKIKEAENAKQQAMDELEGIRSINKNATANLEALQEFGRNESVMLRMDISPDGGSMQFTAYRDNSEISNVTADTESDISGDILHILQDCGYSADDTVLLGFMYDSSEKGSYSAYSNVQQALKKVKGSYKSLYISETDESIFREE